ncbi:MAG: hypothetical protein JWQ38_145 [Flavipsychrobacter sp.]|nr:hypothetical protein [Flavipsychrobacter sp.]
MLSKAQNKYIRSLTQQKFREEYGVFIAEGEKIANEWLSAGQGIKIIVATEEWASANKYLISKHGKAELCVVKDFELATLSQLQTPNSVLLVIERPIEQEIPDANEWYLALDGIQDPGNMGTLIRIADWFGIKNVICSSGCVDVYNPKVVQSAMGGHLRVNIYEEGFLSFLTATKLPKIAATLDGENIYSIKRIDAGILIIGNESKGVSAQVSAMATQKVMIPRKGGAESLNAGVSAGILCALLLPC